MKKSQVKMSRMERNGIRIYIVSMNGRFVGFPDSINDFPSIDLHTNLPKDQFDSLFNGGDVESAEKEGWKEIDSFLIPDAMYDACYDFIEEQRFPEC